MYKRNIIISSIPVLIFSTVIAIGSNKKEKNHYLQGGFAVVELFTSEGCSSCPAADEAVIKLREEFPGNVYILGYHVDYWNYIGWKDEFSQSAFSERQRKYAQQFGLNSVYTPQVIVNGEKEFVGSNRSLLRSTVETELNSPAAYPIELNAKEQATDQINVHYKVSDNTGMILNIALVQLKAATDVKRGENKGRLLHHVNIVRELRTVSEKTEGTISFAIPDGLSAKDMKLIAFLQNKNDWKITAAADAKIE